MQKPRVERAVEASDASRAPGEAVHSSPALDEQGGRSVQARSVDRAVSHGPVRALLAALVLCLFAFALYARALDNPLLLDDQMIVGEHPDVHAPDGWWRLFGHDYWYGFREDRNLYRPVTILSLLATQQLGNGSLAVVRGANVLLLGVTACLLLGWLRAWRVPRGVAWGAALVFLAHPLQAAAIDYIVGRSDLLMLAGVLGFLWCQRSAESADKWSRARALLALLCAGVAIGSKESGVVLLPLALLQSLCMRPTGSAGRAARSTLLLIVAPFALYGAARMAVIGTDLSYGTGFGRDPLLNPLVSVGLAERLPAVLTLVAFYARQVVAPDPSFWHVPDVLPTWGSASAWVGLALALAALGACAGLVWKRQAGAVAVALAIGQFLVIGHLLRPAAFYAANRLAGPFVVAAVALAALALGPWAVQARRREALVLGLSLLVLPLCVRDVAWVNARWTSLESVVKIDLERHPDELDSVTAYAKALLAENKFAQALEYARRSHERKPDFAGSTLWMATAQLGLGQRDEARRLFEEIVREHRDDRTARLYFLEALINLGACELEGGDLDQGRAHLLEAEALRPGDCRLITNLVALAELERDAPTRIRRYQDLLACRPADARRKLARLHDELLQQAGLREREGDVPRALDALELALQIDPEDAQARASEARLRARAGGASEASDE